MSETRARSWWRRWVGWLRTDETTAEWGWRTGRTRRGQEMLAGVVIPPPLDGPPPPPPVASGRRPADPAQPDPATRVVTARDALAAHAQHLWDLADVEESPFAQLGLQDAARRAEKAAAGYATPAPPPPSDEPPDGTVLRGAGQCVWVRAGGPAAEYRWWCAPGDDPQTWEYAHRHGADPGRRLVVLPDPDDRAAVKAIADRICADADNQVILSDRGVAIVVRALAERGNQ